jgi:hypothetical protein
MKKYECFCGLTFKNKQDAEDHEILYLSCGSMLHNVFEVKWSKILLDIFLSAPWRMISRCVGFNIIFKITVNHFNIQFSTWEVILLGIAIGVISA